MAKELAKAYNPSEVEDRTAENIRSEAGGEEDI